MAQVRSQCFLERNSFEGPLYSDSKSNDFNCITIFELNICSAAIIFNTSVQLKPAGKQSGLAMKPNSKLNQQQGEKKRSCFSSVWVLFLPSLPLSPLPSSAFSPFLPLDFRTFRLSLHGHNCLHPHPRSELKAPQI
jgi:hypothetical protein